MTKSLEEQPGLYNFHVIITKDLEEDFRKLNNEMKSMGYIPIISKRRDQGSEIILSVIKRRKQKRFGIWVNIVLLVATLASTIYVGEGLYVSYFNIGANGPLQYFYGFLYFSLPLLIILGTHELGHYYVAKKNGVAASLPFFIPAPITILGTLGAFISLRDPIPDRKTLIRIGAAGPLVGFVMSIIVGFIGAYLGIIQKPVVVTSQQITYSINLPFIYSIVPWLVPKNVHPVAFAAWVGFLVTAINLFPIGQLDGGHVARGLLGENAKYLSYSFIAILIFLGIYYPSWIIFAILVVILGINHPPPLNDISKPKMKEITVGVVAILLVVISFSTVPISPAVQHIVPETATASLSDGNNFLMANYAPFSSENYTLKVDNPNNASISLQVQLNNIPGFIESGSINESLAPHQSRYVEIAYQLANDSQRGIFRAYINVTTSVKSFAYTRTFTVAGVDPNVTANLENPLFSKSPTMNISLYNAGLGDNFTVYGFNSSSVFTIGPTLLNYSFTNSITVIALSGYSSRNIEISFTYPQTYGGAVLMDSQYNAVFILYGPP